MSTPRRRRLAWLFLLLLAMELAFLCCASAHIAHHLCTGPETCAICACLRAGRRRAAVVALLLAVAVALAGPLSIGPTSRRVSGGDTLFARRVRLND